jgi:ABC-type phosphate transport system substrate-binding protein
MLFSAFACACAVIVFFPCEPVAQNIDLWGVVVDKSDAPVPGVIVSLTRSGLADTTEANGSFRITNRNAVIAPVQHFSRDFIQMRGKTLFIKAGNDRNKTIIESFSINGRRFGSLSLDPVAGIREVPVEKLLSTSRGTVMLRITAAGSVFSLRLLGDLFGSRALPADYSGSQPKRAKMFSAADDTLRMRKSGYLTKRMDLTRLVDTLDTVRMYETELGFTAATYPRLDGSALTQPLSVILACKLLGCSYGWVTTLDGSKRVAAYSTIHPQRADSINTRIALHWGTHDAYVKIMRDSADIGLMTRPPTADELSIAQGLGVALDARTAARDAFIMIVNQKNRVANLTIKNIRDIYTGKITNWQQVGWIDATLRPYQRDSASSSQELMMLLVMKELTPIRVSNMVLFGMMGPIDMLTDDTLGLGYSIFFFKEFMSVSQKVVAVPIEGIAPDYTSIFTQRYPLTENVILVTRKGADPAGNAAKLGAFILSEEGQALVKECGYVPLFNP